MTLRATVTQLLAVALAAMTAAVLTAPFVTGATKDPAVGLCGGDRNSVEAVFKIDRPSDIWTVFPAMLKAPELEEDPNPATVVVFSGSVDLSGMVAGAGAQVPEVADAVCIVQSDGTPNFYDGVSRSGYKRP